MKIGLLGDIHGNALALQAVLSEARTQGVKKLLITGDFIGYYFSPAEVLRQLSDWEYDAVRGNHEELLIAYCDDPNQRAAILGKYGSGIQIAVNELSPKQLDWLRNLSHPMSIQIDGINILLCHGSPWDINQYVYPDADRTLLTRCALTGYDIVIMGHTHYSMKNIINEKLIINPGSVGQPRDRKPGAAWAILNTEDRSISFRRELYDLTELAAESKKRHPEIPYLENVLSRT